MGQRRSQRQLRDQALFLREKRKKSVAALAFAFDVSKGTMQQWLADARRDRTGKASERGSAAATQRSPERAPNGA